MAPATAKHPPSAVAIRRAIGSSVRGARVAPQRMRAVLRTPASRDGASPP